jgi:hypothetical protein
MRDCFENKRHGSAGVPPAGIKDSRSIDSKGEAGGMPALPGMANIPTTSGLTVQMALKGQRMVLQLAQKFKLLRRHGECK